MPANITSPASNAAMRSNIQMNRTPILLSILRWLVKLDSKYRQAHKLRTMPDDRLADMGLTRKQVNQKFHQKFGKKIADREPIVLNRGKMRTPS